MIKATYFDYHGVLDKRTFKFGMLGLIARESYNPKLHLSMNDWRELIFKKYMQLSDDYSSGKIEPKIFWQQLRSNEVEKIVSNAKEYILTVEPNTELWDVLLELRDKYYLGIFSDCSKDKLISIQKAFNLSKYFDAWYFSCTYGITKREPKFFELMLANGKFEPGECLFIDDQEKIIESARILGFKGLVFKDIASFLSDIKKII